MPPLYRLESVVKRYDGKTVLTVPALTLEEGGLHFLVGPNGAGKSTLLAILAFLMPPTSGTVRYAGTEVRWGMRSLAALRREVTLLHQAPYLFDETVAANIAFGLKARGIRGAAQRERIAAALDAVGLPDFGPRRAAALSGGEAQRVALARALALRPRVLLLDEPFAAVDREAAGLLERVLRALPAAGTTVVLARHEPVPPAPGVEFIRLVDGALSPGPLPG